MEKEERSRLLSYAARFATEQDFLLMFKFYEKAAVVNVAGTGTQYIIDAEESLSIQEYKDFERNLLFLITQDFARKNGGFEKNWADSKGLEG